MFENRWERLFKHCKNSGSTLRVHEKSEKRMTRLCVIRKDDQYT